MKITFGLLYIVVFKSSSMSHITGFGQPKYILYVSLRVNMSLFFDTTSWMASCISLVSILI